jgi:hypothetical protein
MNRESLIDRLITSGHLNVPGWTSLGHISRSEVFIAIRTRLDGDDHFPPNAAVGKGLVYEGPQIQCYGDGQYFGIDRRASVYDSGVVAESTKRRFETIDSVVNWYINSEWGSGHRRNRVYVKHGRQRPFAKPPAAVTLGDRWCRFRLVTFARNLDTGEGIPADSRAVRN